jgi:hypothetical protein
MRALFVAVSIAFLISSVPNTANATLINDLKHGCSPPNIWNGATCVDAANLATEHTAIMQAYIENYSAIRAKTASSMGLNGRGGPCPKYLSCNTLMAMLQVDSVPASTKMLVRSLLKLPQPAPMTGACRNLVGQVQDKAPQNLETPQQVVKYLQSWSQDQPSCPAFRAAVLTGVAIVQQGEPTIYNPQWIAEHNGGGFNPSKMKLGKWGKIGLADALGAIGGIGGTPAGMVLGACVGSIGQLLL